MSKGALAGLAIVGSVLAADFATDKINLSERFGTATETAYTVLFALGAGLGAAGGEVVSRRRKDKTLDL
ncbi:MAG: hypothetical protein R3D88_02065 [Alphaproteobacteria bacterium]|nr:hypothetical protein [Alphaproteobacteria bacterium]